MDDLDFSKPASTRPAGVPAAGEASYDPALALKFFRIAGEPETFAAGTQIFAERDKPGGLFSKGTRVYLLTEGEVTLTLKGKPVHLVLPGEIFGELAVILDAPRSATASARKNCRVIWLDEKRFLSSLQQVPEFAFMLIGIMVQRLDRSVGRLLSSGAEPPPRTGGHGLSRDVLQDLRHAMGDPTPTPMKAGDAIVTKGAVGVSMYVVTAGRVSIAVDGQIVEHVGPGEIFGESALLGTAIRAATATAETDGAWLPISREIFLKVVKSRPAFGVALLRSMSERIQHITALMAR